MTVQRVPEAPFAQIANEALRDKRLSFRARGILAMVLSHTGEWQANKTWLMTQTPEGTEGRDAIQTALNELTALGYREVLNERGPSGRLRTIVVWRHSPTAVLESRPPVDRDTGDPATGPADDRESRPASEHHPTEHNPNEDQDQSEIARVGEIPQDWFDIFWSIYPRRVEKDAARRAFAKAKAKATPHVICEGARRYRDDPFREQEFTKHPTTWLNKGCWDDEPYDPMSNPAPKSFLDIADELDSLPHPAELGR